MPDQPPRRPFSRREFLRLAGLAGGAATLAACAPQVVTQTVVQTQIVNQTQVVKETELVPATEIVERLITPTPGAAATLAGELTIPFQNDAVFGPLYEAMWREFQALYPNITLNLIWNGDQNRLIAAGTPPALLHGGDVWPKEMQMSLDLDPFIEADPDFDLAQFNTNAIEPLKVGGKLKCLPTFYNISLMYYNRALFDAAGLDYPTADWTKDEFLTAARALTLKDGDKVTQWGVELSHGWWGSWLTFVRQAGGDWMDVANCKVTLDTPEAIAGFEYFNSLVQAGDDKVSWLPTEDSLGGFQGGKVAMSYGSHTGLWNTFRSAGVDFDVEVLPVGLTQQRGGEQALDGYSIHKDVSSPDAAWAALKFLASYDTQYKYYAAVGPTGRSDVQAALTQAPKDERPRAPRNLEAVFNAFDEGFGMGLPRHLGFIEATQNHVQPVIDLILEGQQSVADGLATANQAAQDYLDSTYPSCADSTY